MIKPWINWTKEEWFEKKYDKLTKDVYFEIRQLLKKVFKTKSKQVLKKNINLINFKLRLLNYIALCKFCYSRSLGNDETLYEDFLSFTKWHKNKELV